jgi:hypothetical protein
VVALLEWTMIEMVKGGTALVAAVCAAFDIAATQCGTHPTAPPAPPLPPLPRPWTPALPCLSSPCQRFAERSLQGPICLAQRRHSYLDVQSGLRAYLGVSVSVCLCVYVCVCLR